MERNSMRNLGGFFSYGFASVMFKNYIKKPLTHVEQLNLLKNRGMAVDDNSTALSILSKVSYYRLSAY
jgi:hypothetical protein